MLPAARNAGIPAVNPRRRHVESVSLRIHQNPGVHDFPAVNPSSIPLTWTRTIQDYVPPTPQQCILTADPLSFDFSTLQQTFNVSPRFSIDLDGVHQHAERSFVPGIGAAAAVAARGPRGVRLRVGGQGEHSRGAGDLRAEGVLLRGESGVGALPRRGHGPIGRCIPAGWVCL